MLDIELTTYPFTFGFATYFYETHTHDASNVTGKITIDRPKLKQHIQSDGCGFQAELNSRQTQYNNL